MEKTEFKKETAVFLKDKGLAGAGAFAVVALDRSVVGMGAGSALVWEETAGNWKVHCVEGNGREGMSPEEIWAMKEETALEAEMYAELYGEPLDEEGPDVERADSYRAFWFSSSADMKIYFHATRKKDGVHMVQDSVSVNWGGGKDGAREVPIVYWNTGSTSVKVDGHSVQPGQYHISFPDDPARLKRRQDAADMQRCLMEQVMAPVRDVQREIMKIRPDYPVNMAATLAWQYYLKHMC